MIRLTVLYNLPENTSEDEFLEWRLTTHQASNEAMPGVIRTDFARITDSWPDGSLPPYRYQTTADFPDRESFEVGFQSEESQARLNENLRKLGDYAFFVSEVLIASED